jgi:hypothetical protein
MISDQALDALKERNPVHAVAGESVVLRRRGKRGFIGPCPMCSDDPRSRTAMRFECDADKWVCAVCQDGGDVIKLVQKREGLSFTAAIDRLGGVREERPTPELARRAGLRAFVAGGVMGEVPAPFNADNALRVAWVDGWGQGRKRELYEAYARERERKRLFDFWQAGKVWQASPVMDYLACRGIMAPSNARLRFHPSMPLFADGREREPILAHRGPAMLAPFLDAEGKFRGLHITWIDTAAPKCKAVVMHPDTGEVLPSKKMRGTKAGCYLDLGGCRDNPRRIIAGEGIETVAAVYSALTRAGRDVSGTAFRAAGDLGNLAGKASAQLSHPTLKGENGRARRVPGPDPDPLSPAMPVPDSVTELVLLKDGDSEPFLTINAMERASRRHAREGRTIRVPFVPDGLDYNDVMQGKDQ